MSKVPVWCRAAQVHHSAMLELGHKEQTTCVTRLHFSESVECDKLWYLWVFLFSWVKPGAEIQSLCEAEPRLHVWGSSQSAIDHLQTVLWRQRQDSTAVGFGMFRAWVQTLQNSRMFQLSFVFALSSFQWPTSSKRGIYSKVTKFLSRKLQEIYKTIQEQPFEETTSLNTDVISLCPWEK